MKINRKGGLIWKRYFASESNDIASNEVQEILTCGTAQISSDSSVGIIRKIDSEGNIIWTTSHRLGQKTTVVSVDIKDSRYYIGGTVRDSSFVKSYVTILDTSGGIISTEIFNSRYKEFMKDLIVTDNGNLIMCIQQVPDSIYYITHSKVLVTDMNLNQKRSVLFDSAQSLQLNSITSDKNGFIIATGSFRYITFGGIDDIWTVRMDSNLSVPLVNIISNLYNTIDQLELSISPNPFNSKADIFWIAYEPGKSVIEIYDMSGRLIRNENLGFRNTGANRFNLNWDQNSSGVYVCVLKLNGRVNRVLRFVSLK
jgi:hypothetical protein